MPFRLLARRLFTLLLVVSLLPGLSDLVENAAHLLVDGHLPHSTQHEQVQAYDQHTVVEEHGCTPMSHNCECHTSVPGVLPNSDYQGDEIAVLSPVTLAQAARTPRSRANAPPTPPPIA